MSVIAFIGYQKELQQLQGLSLPKAHTYVFWDDVEKLSGLASIQEVVFIVTKLNHGASQLQVQWEFVEKSSFSGKQWVFSLDGSTIHPVHRYLLSLPAGPEWLHNLWVHRKYDGK